MGEPVGGGVGLRVNNSHAHFDNVVLAPLTALTTTVQDFACHPHAVKQAGQDRFTYDANGNMVLRVEVSGGQVTTYTQQFDIENRLVAVTRVRRTSGPAQVTRFVYDGDGARIKEVEPGGGAVAVRGRAVRGARVGAAGADAHVVLLPRRGAGGAAGDKRDQCAILPAHRPPRFA